MERIGNCRVVGVIGSGGMAVVYLAVQESLNRTVAVKALKPGAAAESDFALRFEREALSVAALQHENIIQVHDFQHQDGAAYIVMEYVDGIDLFDLLEKSPVLPVDVAAIVALQISRALDYAHFHGIIHRDIKPANIMIARSGGVKLTDFGIARDSAFSDLTRDGTGVGTPSYMSPEQVLGDKLDFRSDVFGLGIVLYQMLCGRKPFVEDDERSVMQKIRTERPAPPRKLNTEVPRELERIVLRCLEKNPADRYPSTQDLVVALERFLASRCRINYRARLVLYLQDVGLVTTEEAQRLLHPSLLGRSAGARPEGSPLQRATILQGGILGAMALAVSLIHLAPIGERRPAPSGFVRVLVEPWADVYVDGRLEGTTPLARPLAVPEGRHHLELRNPHFAVAETREIDVQRGLTQTVKIALHR